MCRCYDQRIFKINTRGGTVAGRDYITYWWATDRPWDKGYDYRIISICERVDICIHRYWWEDVGAISRAVELVYIQIIISSG